jgi:hypothetical protein
MTARPDGLECPASPTCVLPSAGGALVLNTYSHLMPDAEDRARRAIEEALSGQPTAANPANPLPQSLRVYGMLGMESVSIEQARMALGDLVDWARLAGTPTTIMRYRKLAAVLVPISWYERAVSALDGPVPGQGTDDLS